MAIMALRTREEKYVTARKVLTSIGITKKFIITDKIEPVHTIAAKCCNGKQSVFVRKR